MGWSEKQTRLQAAVFASLGLDATWNGVAVRVIVRDQDEAFGRTVVDSVTLRVRQTEVPTPATGDTVEIDDGRTFEVIGEPLLDRKLNWVCEAAPA